jgi:hypothetical protein
MRWKRSMIGIRQPQSWIGLFGGRYEKWSGWLAQWPFAYCADKCPRCVAAAAVPAGSEPVGLHCPVGQD